MEWITVKQASEKWGVTARRVQELCKEGKIKGATRWERTWMIPSYAVLPSSSKSQTPYMPMPKKSPFLDMTSLYNKAGEADIIAIKDDELHFIEVKTRSNEKFGRPAEAVDYKKQERYKQIASYYLLANKLEDVNISFSVIEILKNDVNLIKNAF